MKQQRAAEEPHRPAPLRNEGLDDDDDDAARTQPLWRRFVSSAVKVALGGLAVYACVRLVRSMQPASSSDTQNAPFDVASKPAAAAAKAPLRTLLLESAARCVDKKNLRWGEWKTKVASESILCGEDSFFVSATAFGVADGVGGWAKHGVTSKHFSQGLVTAAMDVAREAQVAGKTPEPFNMLAQAHIATQKTVEAGSTTACFGAIRNDGLLRVGNVGDSGVCVVRGGKIVFQAEETNHGFNYPKQLGSFPSGGKSDNAADAWLGAFQLQAEDVVVAATDGVFDNIRPSDIADVAYHTVGEGRQKNKQPDVDMAATDIVHKACTAATSSGSWGSGPSGVGGKPDDVTVVVLRVVHIGTT